MLRCRNNARNLALMRVLVLREFGDSDVIRSVNRIAHDEMAVEQLGQQRFAFSFVIWQAPGLDALGPIFKATLSVRFAPKSDEKQTRERRTFGKQFVVEKARFDVAGSTHFPPPSKTRDAQTTAGDP